MGGEFGSVVIYYVANPYNPVFLNQIPVYDYSYDLTVYDGCLYTAGYWGGMQIFDLSDPANPLEISYYPLDLAFRVEANENISFIGDPYTSLRIFDTMTISDPVLVRTYDIGNVTDLDFFDNTLYAAAASGIHIYDVTDPNLAHEINSFADPYPVGIIASQDYLYCTESLQFDVYGDTTIVKTDESLVINNFDKYHLSNFPNPFNPVTAISFSMPDNGRVDLAVYNIKGQKIRTLVDTEFAEGKHTVSWDGADDSGNVVSSGVYCFILRINGRTEVLQKCLLLK
jgi:hypothetical protein